MDEIFARIGQAITTLTETTTLADKSSLRQLAEDLQSGKVNVNQMIEERVRAGLEAMQGRMEALENEHKKTRKMAQDAQKAAAKKAKVAAPPPPAPSPPPPENEKAAGGAAKKPA